MKTLHTVITHANTSNNIKIPPFLKKKKVGVMLFLSDAPLSRGAYSSFKFLRQDTTSCYDKLKTWTRHDAIFGVCNKLQYNHFIINDNTQVILTKFKVNDSYSISQVPICLAAYLWVSYISLVHLLYIYILYNYCKEINIFFFVQAMIPERNKHVT